ncbi:TIR domain-containing protein [Sinorhizobium saheli]|uniref:Nucleotide-binding protein containing TIR-like domain protein n=1 Tax=Sinorhizobium saheli TaxID=36856 RepID=A0A178Y6T2_SINSA|nr:nucleotide-binding protein [Sinorhizobium saheli]MQW87784.1 nucleotide-binding protein containing TIR-like domain protein [Sinorhizobium saheli]OAP43116.1 nucleotide-binding protein containing TIR-like domain protein [Sinorhizobium saheli]
MFHLFMTSVEGYWNETSETSLGWDRVFEYTSPDVKEQFLPLQGDSIGRVVGIPALFTYEFAKRLPADEGDLPKPSRIGRVTTVHAGPKEVRVEFEIDQTVAPIPAKEIHRISERLNIAMSNGESYRSHWAVKNVDLIGLLKEEGLYTPVNSPKVEEELLTIAEDIQKPNEKRNKVFIVHGHDEAVLNGVARWINKIGLEEVILNEHANKGRTVISKLSELAEGVEFAVVLLTPDDVGGVKGGEQSYRPRQNVVFELGYFLAKLGPSRVAVVKSGELETPSDFGGVLTVDYDAAGSWKIGLAKEFSAAGLRFDLYAGI